MGDPSGEANLDNIDIADLSQMAPLPSKYLNIIPDADAYLYIKESISSNEVTALGISAQAVRIASPLFAAELAISEGATDPQWQGGRSVHFIDVTREGDGFVWLLCMNIMHLQHNMLPNTLDLYLLAKLARFAKQYMFVNAVSWSTSNWFDHLYNQELPKQAIHPSGGPSERLARMIEAAYNLDQPMYFARFTSRLLLRHPYPALHLLPHDSVWNTSRLLHKLQKHRQFVTNILRRDMDLLLHPVATVIGEANRHYVGFGAGIEPEEDELNEEEPLEYCVKDTAYATKFLASLGDANMWPSFAWSDFPGELIDQLRYWRAPSFDLNKDRCLGCRPVVKELTHRLDIVRSQQAKRQYGLCLDCFVAGKIRIEACRIEHVKNVF